MAHKYTIEFDEETWQSLLRHAGRGNIKDYITHLLDREFASAKLRAVVLCGGEASDLYPTSIPIPKAMLPVGYRPVVEYLLEHLVDHGIAQITFVTGARGNVKDHFAKLETPGVELDFVSESEPQGTAGALRAVRHQVRDTFLVLNGDILTNVDVARMVRAHRAGTAQVTMLLTHPDHSSAHDAGRLGWVETDADGRVTSLQEGHGNGGTPPRHFNGGVYVLEPSIFDEIPEKGAAGLERDVLPKLIAKGQVRGWVMHESAYWRDVADPAEFSQAWEDVLTGRFSPR